PACRGPADDSRGNGPAAGAADARAPRAAAGAARCRAPRRLGAAARTADDADGPGELRLRPVAPASRGCPRRAARWFRPRRRAAERTWLPALRRAGRAARRPPDHRAFRARQVADSLIRGSGILADMGRIFEVRKHTMFARWNRMAKQFARIAKDINMAVKASGADPASNPTLRRVIQNARAVNMPKDKVEAAIKRASGRDATNYHQVLYEGYAPHGIALLIETATDNPTRTVAHVRN